MKNSGYIACILLLAACGKGEKPADAFGNFEAQEYTVSAESNGKVVICETTEGMSFDSGSRLALIDTIDFSLRKLQLISQRAAIIAKASSLEAQKNVYEQQIVNLRKDKVRFEKMSMDGAATQKQLDDIDGSISLAYRQKEAIEAQFASITAETSAVTSQIDQVSESVRRCNVVSPVEGTILEAYVKQGEFVNIGKPLFKIAKLEELDLRVYFSGDQLAAIKVGQEVKVYIDGDSTKSQLTGKISWISSEAEFTPKIIQTRKERVNLVYAVKVHVENDGRLKIGMPGEVRL